MTSRAPLQAGKPVVQASVPIRELRTKEEDGAAAKILSTPDFCQIQLHSGRILQTKRVNEPGDAFEREADRMAELVVNGKPAVAATPSSPKIQREEAKEPSDEEKLKKGAEKIGEAFLKTPLGKELKDKILETKEVKGAINFVDTLPGKIVAGAAAVGTVSALAATHSELPLQIPEIPLDFLKPGLSVKLVYKGPVDQPTEASISFTFAEQGPKSSKPALTATEKQRAENAQMAADQEKFRAGMRFPPGSPEGFREQSEKALIAKLAADLTRGPDVSGILQQYPGLQEPAKTGPQLSMPTPNFGYQPPKLLGEELKFKPLDLPGFDDPKKEKSSAKPISRKASTNAVAGAVPAIVDQVLHSSGQPLESSTRVFMESRFGRDFSQVRVHTDASAGNSARAIQARAYTSGNDIVFSPGQFSPRSADGQRLLAHELAHVVQQSGTGSNEAQVVRRAPADEEAKRFVTDAIALFETAAAGSRVDLTSKSVKFDPAKFSRQLQGWKAMLENVQGVIDSSLAKDPALTASLHAAYTTVVKETVALAANRLGQTPHAIYTEHRDEIADFALPQASSDPAGSELSGALPASERTNLTVITDSLTLGVDDLFSTTTAKMTVPLPDGVTAHFASGILPKLRSGLSNVAGKIIPKPLVLNSTMTLVLDLEAFGGDFGAYRFTYLEHKARGKTPATSEVLIEHLGAAGVEGQTKSQVAAAEKKFNAHGFKRGSGWNDADWTSVLEGISKVPDSILSPVDGITFSRQKVYAKDPTAGGNYSPEKHTITLFDLAFSATSATRFAGVGGSVSTITTRALEHEIGHAVDLLPLRKADVVEQKREIFKTAFAEFEDPKGSGSYSFPNTEQGRFDRLKADIATAEAALLRVRSESGQRYKDTNGTLEMVEGGKAAGSNKFREAAIKDGKKGITQYSDTEWQEYYAEAFSFYMVDPETLERLRPNVFKFFSSNHPR